MDFTRRLYRLFLIVTVITALATGASSVALGAAKPVTVTPVSSELLPPEQTISLELKGTDIRDALDALAKLTGTNIIADQGVQGTITVTLNEVPFHKALDLMIKANGFSYRWVGNIVLVAKGDRLNEALDAPAVQTFTLKNAKPQEMAKALSLIIPAGNIIVDDRTRSLVIKGTPTMLSSAKQMLAMLDVEEDEVARVFPLKGTVNDGLKLAIQAAIPNGSVSVGPAGRSVIVKATPSELAEVERLIANLDKEEILMQVFPLRFAVADDIKEMVEKATPDGNVSVGPGGKSLIVKATKAQLEQVEKIVSGIDRAAGPWDKGDVGSTSVKVYELKYANTEDVKGALGLVVPTASVQVAKKDRTIVIKGTDSDLKKADELLAKLDGSPRQVAIEARVEEISLTAYQKLGIDWTIPLDLVKDPTDVMKVTKIVSDFKAALQILENDGDATVLANPRVTVVDGKEASIHVGDRIPLVIEKETTENNVTKVTQTVEFITAGIILKVTPRFNEGNTLTLTVSPEVSNIVGQTSQGYPQIRTRTAQTTMVFKDGETIALGGLISENEVDSVRKVPLLGDIPLLGRLFQTKTKDKRQSEIVIFLTTRIVPANAVPATK